MGIFLLCACFLRSSRVSFSAFPSSSAAVSLRMSFLDVDRRLEPGRSTTAVLLMSSESFLLCSACTLDISPSLLEEFTGKVSLSDLVDTGAEVCATGSVPAWDGAEKSCWVCPRAELRSSLMAELILASDCAVVCRRILLLSRDDDRLKLLRGAVLNVLFLITPVWSNLLVFICYGSHICRRL